MHKIVIFTLLTLLLSPAQAELTFESHPAGTECVQTGDVVNIKSVMGIGTVTIRPGNDGWPKALKIRFYYKKGDTGMSRLESLKLETDLFIANGQYRRKPGKVYFWPKEKQPRNHKILENRTDLSKDGAVELTIPPSFLKDTTQLRIDWVDSYR